MKVTVIPIINSALGIVPQSLANKLGELEIRKRILTILTTALLKSARRLEEFWRPEETPRLQ